ncbi:rhamnogalacturonate lyase [Haloferula helveola]|uniref:Rhamnogalacturonate lyase n=2 Tax=Haloferula helveola TaxID=490095 RepID=A0ABM7R8C0_9BACT|nr:rhamnogalacturonate lyase [Haloferula helveola]
MLTALGTAGWMLLMSGFASAGDFGVTEENERYTVDTGAGLVFRVLRSNGDIDSIRWKGMELRGRKTSHIASGLGSKGTMVELSRKDDMAVITLKTDSTNGVVEDLTHYYIVRKGENTIYMATHAEKQPRVGELRWIARLKREPFSRIPEPSDVAGNTGAVESQDVFRMPDRTTRSKYYGNQQAKDLSIRGVGGEGIGAFIVYGNRESSSGGPFFRDIQNQSGSELEVYNYMNSGHLQTEPRRSGVLYGPYALCFTDGSAPEYPDMDFVSKLNLKGMVPSDQRGAVHVEDIDGMDERFPYMVAFSNADAQYWAEVRKGEAMCEGMKPGKYEMVIFKGELVVHRDEIVVSAKGTLVIPSIRIDEDPSTDEPVWRIGDWDGTPLEFRNGSKLSLMHPSDPRMEDWMEDNFTVGEDKAANFPACQWAKVNGSREIHFKLSADQLKAHTIRIGITTAHSGGRPKIHVNDWSARNPGPSSQPQSRGMTIGSYRGNNVTYRFDVPAEAFVEGINTVTIWPISGQQARDFLSPGYAFDCLDMLPAGTAN